MATHPRILAWKIPWPGEPDGLQSMGSQRVRHNSVTFTFRFHALEKEMATHSSVLAWPRGILECNPEIPAFPGEEH